MNNPEEEYTALLEYQHSYNIADSPALPSTQGLSWLNEEEAYYTKLIFSKVKSSPLVKHAVSPEQTLTNTGTKWV